MLRHLYYRFLAILVLFVLISLAGFSFFYNYQQFITLIVIPTLLFLSLAINRFRVPSLKDIYVKAFLLIVLLGFLLLPISLNMDSAFDSLIQMMGVAFCVLFTRELLSFTRFNFVLSFLNGFVFSFLFLLIYLFSTGQIADVDISSSYIDRRQFGLNANFYSYFSYFCNISLFYLIQLTGKRIYILLSFICLILGIYISFITVSRSGVLFTGLVGVSYWAFISRNRFSSSKLRFLISLLLVVGILTYAKNVYESTYLKARVDQSIEEGDSRGVLIRNAFDVFLDNPVTGVGPGQFYLYSFNKSSYSHNSFAEISANFGIAGILLLTFLYFSPLTKLLRRSNSSFASEDKPLFRLHIMAITSFILLNNIYVFYMTTYGMIFFYMLLHLGSMPAPKTYAKQSY